MPVRTIATLVIAILLGLIAVLMINGFLKNAHPAATAQGPTGPGSPVVVAALPITRGATLTPEMLKVVNYPVGAVPTGAFGAINALVGGKDAQRVAMRDLGPDEPVLATRVSAPGGHLNLSNEISPGMQAVAVRMSDVAGVGGFVVPGERVDILLTRSGGGGNGHGGVALTQIIAQNIRVLGIDQTDDEENGKPTVVKTATIEVTPAQAALVTLAQAVGDVSFSLRHINDTQPVPKTLQKIPGLDSEPASRPIPVRLPKGPPVPVAPTIRVTRATEVTDYQLSGR